MNSQYVIGVDPDSSKHGIAIYKDSKLVSLHNWTLPEIVDYLAANRNNSIIFSIEDPDVNKFIYSRNEQKSKKVQTQVGMKVGKNQQSQVELERMLDWLEIKYIKHRPQTGNWCENVQLFRKVTKWIGQSNKDTRSAAYFGYLALKR